MTAETFSEVEVKLAFITEQTKKNDLPHDFVYKVLQGESKKASLFDAIEQFLPQIAKIIEGIFENEEIKVFTQISIENPDPTIFTSQTIKVAAGDLIKVNNNGEDYWVIVTEYSEEEEHIYAKIYSDLVEMGNQRMVRLEHKHIFDYKAAQKS